MQKATFLIWLSCLGLVVAAQAGDVGPWRVASPAAEGLDAAKLEEFWRGLDSRSTTALLVLRNDRLVFERYADNFSRTKPHGTASLAKALVGGVSLMLALDDGLVEPDALAARYVPQWTNSPLKNLITLAHLATHTSGIEDAEADKLPHAQLTGWKGDFWKQLAPPRDPFTLARDIAPVLDPPGTRARYSNPGMGMLGYCITASLRGSTNTDLRALLKCRVLDPLGVPAAEWSVGYGSASKVDGLNLVATWGGAAFSPNAAARIGSLLLHKGNWNGRQLISSRTVQRATTNARMPNHSGLGWWVNTQADGTRVWKALPPDAFYGSGAGHQFLLVVPSLNLVVVRNGQTLDAKLSHEDALEQHLVSPLMACLAAQK